MSKKEQWMFLYKTGQLLQAGLPIEESVSISLKKVKNKKLRFQIQTLITEMGEGKSFAESLSRYGDWDRSTIALVHAGEVSETLSKNLLCVADGMKARSDQRNKMMSALFYPAIISFLALGMIFFLLMFVYPKIVPLFTGMRAELPFSTRLMIEVSSFISRYWIYFILSLLVMGFPLWYSITKWMNVRHVFEGTLIKIPFIGKVIHATQLAEISFLVSSLCSGGMTSADAIKICSQSSSFLITVEKLNLVYRDLQSGLPLSECINRQEYFPSIWEDLLLVGEKTGSLATAFGHISEMHIQESEETMALVNKLIEPLMMIVVGGVVGFIALSIITPMYSLTQQMHG